MKKSVPSDQLLLNHLLSFFNSWDDISANSPLYVGLSGGVDSVVLCHALHSMLSLTQRSFTIVHINHQLQDNADEFVQQSQSLARKLNVPIVVEEVQVDSQPRTSIEAQARAVRYKAFTKLLEPNAMLLLAHHQDDQAETFLLNALRGADINALGGMQTLRKHKTIWIGRPMLQIERKDILNYASMFDLQWSEDTSNTDETIRRNFLRHGVLKKIEENFPESSKMLARSASRLQVINAHIQDEAEAFLQTQTNEYILSLAGWRALSPALAMAVLRLWFQKYSVPAQRQLNELVRLFRKENGRGEFRWRSERGEIICFVWRDYVFLYSHEQLMGTSPIKYLLSDGYEVRCRVSGQRVLFKGQSRQVKTLLKQMGVFPWWRDNFPILFKNDSAVMLGNLRLDKYEHSIKLIASSPYQLGDL